MPSSTSTNLRLLLPLLLSLGASAQLSAQSPPPEAPTPAGYHASTPSTPLINGTMWEKIITIDSASGKDLYPHGFTVMNDGGLLIVTGTSLGYPPSGSAINYMIETDNTGSPRYVFRNGGVDSSIMMSIGVEAAGEARRFVGYKADEGFPPHGFRYHVSTSISGELLSWGYRDGEMITTNYTVTAPVGDSGLIEAGQLTNGEEEFFGDIILRRIDAWGNVLWSSRFAKDTDNSTVLPLALRQLSGGGYAMSFFYDNPPLPVVQGVAGLDADGKTRWIHHFDSTYNGLLSLSAAPGGGVYVLTTEHGSNRTVVTRLDASGEEVWTRYYPAQGTAIAVASATTLDGGLVIGGVTGAVNEQNRLIDSTQQFYVARLLSSGEIDWEALGGRPGRVENLLRVEVARDGHILLLGWMRDLDNVTKRELYIAALPDAKLATPLVDERAGALGLAAMPNPASSFITAKLHLRAPGRADLALIDPLGVEVATWHEKWLEGGSHELRLDLPPLASGLYFLHLRSAASSVSTPVTIVR